MRHSRPAMAVALATIGRGVLGMVVFGACFGQSCGYDAAALPEDEQILGYTPDPPPSTANSTNTNSTDTGTSTGTSSPDDSNSDGGGVTQNPDTSTPPVVPPTDPSDPVVTDPDPVTPPAGGTETLEAPKAITVTSSGQSGVAPLTAVFGVLADQGSLPSDVAYRWTLDGLVRDTASGVLEETFSTPGTYSVAVCVTSPSWATGVERCAERTVVASEPLAIPVNQAPGALDAQAATDRGRSVDISLSGADPEAQPMSFQIITGPAHGTLGAVTTVSSTMAAVTYTPAADFIGTDQFTFQTSDGSVSSSSATVSIEVRELPLVRIVVVPSLHRVFRNDLEISGDSSVSIQCARGETESCQVVLANYGVDPLRNTNIECWLDTRSSGSDPKITPFRVHYVQVVEPTAERASALQSNPRWAGPGWYPDALIPFTDPYTGQAPGAAQYMAAGYELPAGQCQPYWLDFTVPTDAPTGEYSGLVRITGTRFLQEIPVHLTVWNYAVPAGSGGSLPVLTGCANGRIASIYGEPQGTERFWELRARHDQLLELHRIHNLTMPSPQCDPSTGHAIVDEAYLASARAKIDKDQLSIGALSVPIDDKFNAGWEKFKTYVRDVDAMMAANPWIPPLFLYIIDEPNTQVEYEQAYQLGEFLHSEHLRVRSLVTGTQREQDGWAPLASSVDIPVYSWGYYWDAAAVAARQAAGDSVWSYTALANPADAPSWLLDAPPIDYMVPFWASWSLRLDGMLYWTSILDCNRWGIDPWVNPAVLTYSSESGAGLEMNGEGQLMMPGTPAGVDGPLPTIRLKILRDGLESYATLKLLAELGGRAASDSIAATFAASYREWNDDYHAYMTARQRLAEEILAR